MADAKGFAIRSVVGEDRKILKIERDLLQLRTELAAARVRVGTWESVVVGTRLELEALGRTPFNGVARIVEGMDEGFVNDFEVAHPRITIERP